MYSLKPLSGSDGDAEDADLVKLVEVRIVGTSMFTWTHHADMAMGSKQFQYYCAITSQKQGAPCTAPCVIVITIIVAMYDMWEGIVVVR